jgi:hypothetical protein
VRTEAEATRIVEALEAAAVNAQAMRLWLDNPRSAYGIVIAGVEFKRCRRMRLRPVEPMP